MVAVAGSARPVWRPEQAGLGDRALLDPTVGGGAQSGRDRGAPGQGANRKPVVLPGAAPEADQVGDRNCTGCRRWRLSGGFVRRDIEQSQLRSPRRWGRRAGTMESRLAGLHLADLRIDVGRLVAKALGHQVAPGRQ